MKPGTFVLRTLPWVVVAAILAFYVWVQVHNFAPAYGEVDPDGYIVLAKRMAAGGPLAVRDNDPFLYQTHVWVENSRGQVVPKFSPGYPAMLAVAYKLGGDEAMFIVSPILGGLGLIGAFLLFRLWMPLPLSIVALAVLAANRMFLFYSGYLLTHTADLCFAVWGMYFVWKYVRRPGVGWAIGAGLCLGFAATIRHTSALLALPMLIAAVAKLTSPRAGCGTAIPCCQNAETATDALPLTTENAAAPLPPSRVRLILPTALMLLSYAVFPAMLAVYDWLIFGHPLTTGYALSGEQDAFAWMFFKRDFDILNGDIVREGFFIIFATGLAGMIFAGSRLERLLCWAWFLPLYFVYGSYYWITEYSSFSRFFINTIPLLAGMTFAMIDRLQASRAMKLLGSAVLAAIIIVSGVKVLDNAVHGKLFGWQNEMASAGRAIRANRQVRDDAVIFTHGPINAYVGTLADYRLYDMRAFTDIHNEFQPPKPPDPEKWWEEQPRRQPERTARFAEFYKTHSAEQLRQLKRDTVRSRLQEGRQVVFIVPERDVAAQRNELGPGFVFTEIGTAELFHRQWAFYQVTAAAPTTATATRPTSQPAPAP